MTQDEADKLPTHPVFGRWMACQCGHPSCKYVYPSEIGTFYQGAGFTTDEARRIIGAMKPVETSEGQMEVHLAMKAAGLL